VDDFFEDDTQVAVEEKPKRRGRTGRKNIETTVEPLIPDVLEDGDDAAAIDSATEALGFDAEFPVEATLGKRNTALLNRIESLRHPLTELRDVPLVDITLDERLQPRIEMNVEVIKEYAESMQIGDTFPPVHLFEDGETLYLADGWHRFQAAQLIGREFLTAEVSRGSFRDAVWFSASVNTTHGLRRSNEDKRRAVTRLLVDTEWGRLTDRAIATNLRVSDRLVATVRAELVASGAIPDLTTRITADGYPINVAPIAEATSAAAKNRGKKDVDEFDNPDDDTLVSADTGEPLGAGVSDAVRSAVDADPALQNRITEDESHFVRAFDAIASLIPVLYVDPRNAVSVAQSFRRAQLVLMEERVGEIKEWVLTFESAVETAKNLRGTPL